MLKPILTALTLTTMLCAPAMAEETMSQKADSAMHQAKDLMAGTSINKLATSGDVTVSGEVKAIDTIDNEFTLADETGSIDVEMTDKLNVAVGDKVTVSGALTTDIGEKEIAASKVTIDEHAADKENKS